MQSARNLENERKENEQLRNAVIILRSLARQISNEALDHNTLLETLHFWMLRANILNMRQVCEGFKRGSLFYMTDVNHFASDEYNMRPPMFHHLSTQPGLKAIKFYQAGVASSVGYSYMIADDDLHPSETLKQILYSITAMDCRAAIQLAFYMSLLNMLIFFSGEKKGRDIFDQVFSAKPQDKHNLNRFRIGVMGTSSTRVFCDFAPIYFFTKTFRNITLEILKQHPDAMAGFHLSVGGHKQYLLKFPRGAAQAWNLIFVGLNAEKQPLFYGARGLGEDYFITYNEIISLLNNEYNRIPSKNEVSMAALTSNENELVGLSGVGVGYSMERINLLMTDPEKCLVELKQFCDNYYEKEVQQKGYTTVPTFKDMDKSFQTNNIIRETKDDLALDSVRFFKSKSRQDLTRLMTQDDTQLNVSYRVSNQKAD